VYLEAGGGRHLLQLHQRHASDPHLRPGVGARGCRDPEDEIIPSSWASDLVSAEILKTSL
jgi:hypothetical protein